MENAATFRCKSPSNVFVWDMSTHKLARTISAAIPPQQDFTTLILDHMGPDAEVPFVSGKVRLEYGTGRQSESSGPRVAVEERVQVSEVDDQVLFVVSEGTDRQTLAADELSRRLYAVCRSIFDTHENKKPRLSGRGGKTKRPKKMWFRLVICDQDGRTLNEHSFELHRDDRERVSGDPDTWEDEDAGEPRMSASSQEPEERMTRILLRERAEMHGAQMTLVEQAQGLSKVAVEQAKTSADQVRVLGDALMAWSETTEGFVTVSMRVHAEAVEVQAAAMVAKAEAEAIHHDAERNANGFWDTPAGEMLQGQLGGLATQVVEAASSGDKVTDFLSRIAAKAMLHYEKWSANRP
jgi:hypothetical protein